MAPKGSLLAPRLGANDSPLAPKILAPRMVVMDWPFERGKMVGVSKDANPRNPRDGKGWVAA